MTFIAGGAVALITVGLVRTLPDGFGAMSLAAVTLTVAVFFTKPDRVFAFATGVGLGLDQWSAYPFFTWSALMLGAAALGIWLFGSYFTNRSLFSFLILGSVVHIGITLGQFTISHIGSFVFHQPFALNLNGDSLADILKGIGIGLVSLYIIFSLYTRVRGRSASVRLTPSPTWRS
jgi:hypothetical protein